MRLNSADRWFLVAVFNMTFATTAILALGQTAPSNVDVNKAQLIWTWTQGAGGPAEKWLIRCGPSSNNYTVLKEIAVPSLRSYLIKDIPLTNGNWVCIVAAGNVFGTGGASPEVMFQAGQAPGAVDTLIIGVQ